MGIKTQVYILYPDRKKLELNKKFRFDIMESSTHTKKNKI